jgi:hypothetical protein
MSDQLKSDEHRFWNNILGAVHTTPRATNRISGASGLTHEIITIGIDDASKRMVIVSPEHDGRTAALVQSDIQGAHPDYRVLTIRPAAVSVSKLAQAIQAIFGSPIMTEATFAAIQKDQAPLQSALSESIGNLAGLSKRLALPKLPQILELIQQLAKLNFARTDLSSSSSNGNFSIDLTRILSYDPIGADRDVGVCGFPFYDFNEQAIDSILTASSTEEVADALRQRDIFQYFYPAPDQLALGLVERGITCPEKLTSVLGQAPKTGHPFGQTELVEAQSSVLKAINALQAKNLLVEGEFGLEVSQDGVRVRSMVKFKPKEGIISKLINRFSLNFDLKDLFGGTKGGE